MPLHVSDNQLHYLYGFSTEKISKKKKFYTSGDRRYDGIDIESLAGDITG